MSQSTENNLTQSPSNSQFRYPSLYYFTDDRNLESILKHGLLSWYQLDCMGITYYPVSNQLSRCLDSRKNLRDYVRLCLNTSHPMMWFCLCQGRISRVRWLKISPTVWSFSSNLYSNTNAASNCATIDSKPSTVLVKGDRQAEVLIRTRIDPSYISVI